MELKNKKIITIIIFLGLSFAFLGSLTGLAEAASSAGSWDKYTPLAPLPGTTNAEGKTDIQTYIPGAFKLAIGIAGVLAVLMIIIGGVEYITTDAIQGKSEGKERIQNALWGLVLVLVSWILLYTINPKLTVFNLNVETTTSSQTGSGYNSGSGSYDSGNTTDNTANDFTSVTDNNPLTLPSNYDPLKNSSSFGDDPLGLPPDYNPFKDTIETSL